ncbi:MAG: hypothetical protein FJX29_03765, partial [Alphaproteobacteria bacterium]|nr:hypothetical protein [Alphaproteobacteria bacterium]
WAAVHLHIGTADIPARIALLKGRSLEPGANMLAQIVAGAPVSVMHGERFILRDHSAQRTIGGGIALDPFAPARGRVKPQRLDLLSALETSDHDLALRQALDAAPGGFAIGQFAQARNLDDSDLHALPVYKELTVAGHGLQPLAFHADDWLGWLKKVTDFVASSPSFRLAGGVSEQMIVNHFRGRLGAPAIAALLQQAVKEGSLEHAGGGWRLRGEQAGVAPADLALWNKLAPLIDDEKLRPPSIAEMAKALSVESKKVDGVLRRAARIGLAIQVSSNRFYAPHRLRALAEMAEELAGLSPQGFDARAFRDRSGVGRNLTIEVLEHFDRMGLTKRSEDLRSIRRPAKDLLWGRAQAK